MHKVIGFELKKMVSRPGIYILALLLAGLLTVTAFIYKPTEQKKTYYNLNGTTVVEVDNSFASSKSQYDQDFVASYNIAMAIAQNDSKYYSDIIKKYHQDYLNTVEIFVNNSTSPTISQANLKSFLQEIHNDNNTGSLDQLFATIRNYVGEYDSTFYPVVTLKSSYNTLLDDMVEINDSIDSTFVSHEYQVLAGQFLNDFNGRIQSAIDELVYPDYSSFINTYIDNGNYYIITKERLSIIESKMSNILAQANENAGELNSSKTLIGEYNDLYNEYRLTIVTYSNLLQYNINNAVLEKYSASNRLNVRHFDTIDYYKNKENLTKYTHYIETDTNEYSYANPLSFNYSSNEEKNAYDYSYYALSLFGVILIAFAITFASYSIAGETKEGTMRFVSIRPVSRTSLIMGKFLSIAIISFIMLMFSAVASMVVGGFMFGLKSMKILSIVNASKVIVIHPMWLLAIFVGSLYIKILIYTSIAMLFTSFLKSDLLALILTLLIYVVHLMLPMFFGASSWLRFNPLCNIDLFAFLGSGTMSAKTILGQMFTSTIYSGINLWLSIIFIVAIIVVLNLISIFAFKKREL